MNELAGMFFLVFGFFLIVFRARISRRAMEDWSRTFPRAKVRKSIYDAFILVGGLAFVGAGTMILLGVIQPR